MTSGAELTLIGWKIVPNEEHVQCDHRFASQPLANEPLHSSQLFDTSLQKARDMIVNMRVGTLIVATIRLQLIQNR